jgi:cysteine synthase
MARFDSILDTIGNTPVVKIRRLAPPGINLYVKIEAFNPTGSVKDRMARAVIEDAECRGALRPGQTVIEATSGNTGIALAMVCAQKGYPLVITMAENFSIERRRLMRFLGARVVLTPASAKGTGMLEKAVELAETHGWFLCRQFENEANADVHSATTAREILEDFAGDGLDYWVSGFGSGGTLKGVARVLRRESPRTRVVACEPDNAPVLGSGVAQPRRRDGSPSASHPMFRPHLMQGWSPDFVAKLTEDAVGDGLVDEVLPVSGAEALRLSRALAREEGIFVGISSGATFAGALEICRRVPAGTNVLCMLTDTGERYLSTPLFADVDTEMDAEEMEISRSTPSCRFDTPAPAAPTPARPPAAVVPAAPDVDAEAEEFVSAAVGDTRQPVVMFALQWCEFCWSVRKLFDALGISYRAVDLDAVEYQAGDLGGRIRGVLARRTGSPTIPQIFIAGQHVGGCTDVFDAFRTKALQARLTAAGVSFDARAVNDPYTLLPAWLHPRRSA